MSLQSQKIMLFSLIAITLLATGCGEVRESTGTKQTKTIENTTTMSTYITKGNFVDVASFAYKKVTDTSFSDYGMNIELPGSSADEVALSRTYEIRVIKVHNGIKKVIVKNYQNNLEIKFTEDNSITILFENQNSTETRQMSVDDFLAKVKGIKNGNN